ncbi:hypothetical protein GGX14DRAFT_392897 [Mycena pura]|uniref:Uncharacterized protein n=1 Tax=Mycena pura TaxID=153505 RepID=A0AAD6VHW1_9AGAR|nr:hypothetical protein GGX14DRAFT_392897 [Mycena pura]
MMLEWGKLKVNGPKLLANKQNAATLCNVLDPAFSANTVLTEDELRTFEASDRGGAKSCALAGAIFNNKDDKKGQADKHDFMTEKLGKPHPRFPDTSNIRFSSHGDAAAELITYIIEYLEMMDVIRWSKVNSSLTNIEKNLRDTLNRGPGTEKINLLDLGPLHTSPWRNPLAIEAVIKLIPSLSHLKAITMAFFRSSLTTWIRFSSEFAPGGLIDQCSASEKQLAWMPSTNDTNEGALGAYYVAIWGKPCLTLHHYNSLVMYRRNDTQDFMDAVLTNEDHTFIMREARKIDSNGLERLRRQDIVDFRVRTAEMNKAKALASAQKALEIRRELRKTVIVARTATLTELTIVKTHLQLNALRLRGVPNILPNSRYTRKPAKVAALEEVLKLYLSHPSNFPLPSDPEADLSSDSLTVESTVVDDWTAEEDIEMEE